MQVAAAEEKGGGREIRRVECVGYSLFVFPTATFLCPWGHSYLAKLTRRVRWTLAIGDEHRSQSMHSTTGERRPRKAQLFNFSALARATRARAPPPMARQHPLAGAAPRLSKKNISIFRGPYMLGTTNIFAER